MDKWGYDKSSHGVDTEDLPNEEIDKKKLGASHTWSSQS